jgi:hypothetical protein
MRELLHESFVRLDLGYVLTKNAQSFLKLNLFVVDQVSQDERRTAAFTLD